MEKTGKQKAQARACQAASETHEESKMWHIDGHEQGEHNKATAESESPGFQASIASVAIGEVGTSPILEKGFL